MSLNRKWARLIALVMIVSLMSACGPTPAPQVIRETVVVEGSPQVVERQVTVKETQIVEKQVEVTPTPAARKGAWLDTVIFTSIDQASSAVAQIQADALDIYSYFVEDADAFATTKADKNLAYSMSYGAFDSLMFNVTGPTFQDGRLNPFSNPKIREAMNWLIDRDYLVQEAVGGMGTPKWVVLIQAFPDYAMYADLIRPLEAKYAYDMDKAQQVIAAEMQAMGATLGSDGKWQYDGKPVTLIGLIRSEDERTEIGNYFASQLEKIGFTVERQVRTRDELAPIWQQSDTAEGQWHWYTGGNFYTGLVRNAGNFFVDFYTGRTSSTTGQQAFTPLPEFDAIAVRLQNNDFSSMAERRELFDRALKMSLEDSSFVFVMATYSFFPRKANLSVVTDLGGGVGGAALWPYTMRWLDREGGTVRTAQSGILTGPWNPIAGMNWVQESMLQRATQDDAVISDPFTGLSWPQRIEKAEVTAVEGSPIAKTLDWVDLRFVPQIDVPADAWADWDAKNQKFITVGEKFPEGTTARSKTTIYYQPSLWETKWHDGSPLSVGDFVNYIITALDNGKADSPVYDEAQAPNIEALLSHLKGVRITSTDPLVIETYDDLVDLDAENQVSYYTIKWFPITPNGALPWHTYVLGYLAEVNKELAFTADKSTALEVDWTNYIDGPSLAILARYLDRAQAENYIPFAPTLSQYITADEAKARYKNLQDWYTRRGHFWVGNGLYWLDEVNSVEGSVVAQRNTEFPDPANKWTARFGEPKIAVVDVSGPAKVTAGTGAVFDALVTFQNAPYPQAEIANIKYLLYDGAGSLVASGAPEAVVDGHYQVKLAADVTQKLPAGSAKIEIVVVPTTVSMSTFASYAFMVAGK